MTRILAATLGFIAGLAAAVPVARAAVPRRHVNLPGRAVQAPFSDAVVVGDTVYLAGRIGIDPKTGKPPEDLDQEIRLLLDGIKGVLAEADLTYDRFNAAYRGYFGKDYPARAFVGSGPLLRGGHFEMQGIAVRR